MGLKPTTFRLEVWRAVQLRQRGMPVKKRNVYGAIFFLYRLGVEKKMLQEGLEPPTLGLLDPCSTKLSYQSSCPRSGSNQGPSDLQSDALPAELKRRCYNSRNDSLYFIKSIYPKIRLFLAAEQVW